MSITSFCIYDKRENIPKKIVNEDLSCTGQEQNVQISRSLLACIFKREVLKTPNLAS